MYVIWKNSLLLTSSLACMTISATSSFLQVSGEMLTVTNGGGAYYGGLVGPSCLIKFNFKADTEQNCAEVWEFIGCPGKLSSSPREHHEDKLGAMFAVNTVLTLYTPEWYHQNQSSRSIAYCVCVSAGVLRRLHRCESSPVLPEPAGSHSGKNHMALSCQSSALKSSTCCNHITCVCFRGGAGNPLCWHAALRDWPPSCLLWRNVQWSATSCPQTCPSGSRRASRFPQQHHHTLTEKCF